MKELTEKKLNKILEEHKHWINEVRTDGVNAHKVFTFLSADRKQLITKDSEVDE